MERPLSGCGWWINDEQKDHHMEFSGFLKSMSRVDKAVCILIGNNVLNASPYDGEKLKLRSVKDKHSQYSETIPSSLIIYSCLRRWKLWFQVSCNKPHEIWCTFLLSASSYNVTLYTETSRTVFRHFFSSSCCSQLSVTKPDSRQLGFWMARSTLMFFRKLETDFSFCLIIIGILHSTSVGIHHGFLPVRCEKRRILTCSLKIYLQYFFCSFATE